MIPAMLSAMQPTSSRVMWSLKPQSAYATNSNAVKNEGPGLMIMNLLRSLKQGGIGQAQKITITIEPPNTSGLDDILTLLMTKTLGQ